MSGNEQVFSRESDAINSNGYVLLTHVAISREGAQGKRKSAARLSTADLQNEVQRMVWDDMSDYLKQFSSGTQIVKELERLLIAA